MAKMPDRMQPFQSSTQVQYLSSGTAFFILIELMMMAKLVTGELVLQNFIVVDGHTEKGSNDQTN